MKSFFEEYGFVILAAIVVILLIAMCTPIGNLVKTQITNIVDSFANKTSSKLNAVDSGDASLALTQDGKGVVKGTLTVAKKEAEMTVKYRVVRNSEQGNWTEIENSGTDYTREFTLPAGQNGDRIDVEVYDSEGVLQSSSSITLKIAG